MKHSLLSFLLASILITGALNSSAKPSHDITSLSQWGPYSKEYFGISHIADLKSGIQVEFSLVTGQYRRNFKIPNALFEAGVEVNGGLGRREGGSRPETITVMNRQGPHA